MKKFLQEFKEFAFKSDAFDLAVGVIIGGAFSTIVKSLVDDLMRPLIAFIYSEVVGLRMIASPQAIVKAQNTYVATFHANFKPGSFFSALVQFLIYAFCIFLIVRIISGLRKKYAHEKEAAPDKTEVLLTDIRDLLKEQATVSTKITRPELSAESLEDGKD